MLTYADVWYIYNSAESAYTRVQVSHSDNPAIQFKTHPNIGRPMWQEDKVCACVCVCVCV
jgi:hypothetical protein